MSVGTGVAPIHLPRKRGLGSGKPLAIDTPDTPNLAKLMGLNPAIPYSFSHTRTYIVTQYPTAAVTHQLDWCWLRENSWGGWAVSIMYEVCLCTFVHVCICTGRLWCQGRYSWAVSCDHFSICQSLSVQICHACENGNTLHSLLTNQECKEMLTACSQAS